MIAGLPLGFAQPLVLLGLASLPLLWWLLRLVPPRPRRINFPPTRLLFEIAQKEETPSRTPWWLTLLRLSLAALCIIAAAGPLWNPPLAASARAAPLLILLDDGWAAASTWDARLRTADELIARAEADNRGVAVLPLSETSRDVSLQVAGAARVQIKQLKPKPHGVDRSEALPLIERFLATAPGIEIVWLSDGVDLGMGSAFVDGLKRIIGSHPITVVEGGIAVSHALAAADNAAGALTVKVLRAQSAGAENGLVSAIDLKGLPLGEAPFAFKASDREADATIDLPVEIRNDVARLEIVGERSAGAVQLLDKRWRRRTIGVVSGSAADRSQPLLGAAYYLSRALNPFADVRLAEGVGPAEAVNRFLGQHLPMLILADVGNVAEAQERLTKWIDNGGVLVRFAGPHLAAADDALVPVKLRRGGRILGGSLSWDKPQQLAAFSREGPFNGMAVPKDVTVTRQVLAEPDAQLSDRTWATLADGTPLVTASAAARASSSCSTSPPTPAGPTCRCPAPSSTCSGASSHWPAPPRPTKATLPPPRPPPAPAPIKWCRRRACSTVSARFRRRRRPPARSRAISTAAPPPIIRPAFMAHPKAWSRSTRWRPPTGRCRSTSPPSIRSLTSIAMASRSICADRFSRGAGAAAARRAGGVLAVRRHGNFPHAPARGGDARRLRPVGAMTLHNPAQAQTPAAPQQLTAQQEEFAMKATQNTHLAYIVTGDAAVDEISKAGLQGLTLFLAQRTALEPGEPIGLDPARDELAFFPVIYWPISPTALKPSQAALERIDNYMKQGGTVLFDTRDAIDAPPGPGGAMQGPGMVALRAILSSLDIPELEPVPRDHVLTKTFFLMRDFPGRFTEGQLWVEALPAETEEDPSRPARAGDGVSSIIITSNDFAGAWAMRPDGQPMLPLVPGEPRQREFAFRSGVNFVMYALTGNYKADQVHIPALLERLGQ